jgi:hypothetical protein
LPDKMIVRVPPYEGEYDFDMSRAFNTDEWEWITNISGYLPLTYEDGLAGGDPRLFIAFSVIAMNRVGKITDEDVMEAAKILRKAPFDGEGIAFKGTGEGEDLSPPSGSASDESPASSGDDSSGSTEPSPANGQPEISGIQGSATGSLSVLETSGR